MRPPFMQLLCIFCVLIVKSVGLEWKESTSTVLPSALSAMISGYDSESNSIWLIGGMPNVLNLLQYHVATDTITSHPSSITWNISHYIYSASQQYTQIENKIYFISYNSYWISTFDMNSIAATLYTQQVIQKKNTNRGWTTPCVTQYNQQYLLIIGGTGTAIASDAFKIYNLTNSTWIVGPDLNAATSDCSCIVVSNTVYLIGGYRLNVMGYVSTVDMLDIVPIETISNRSWSPLQTQLSVPKTLTHCVVYDKWIYVLGGTAINQVLDQVDIIDTTSNVIYPASNSLAKPITSFTAIMTNNNHAYIFGGKNGTASNTYSNKIQFASFLSTFSPTMIPTFNPTFNPTPPTIDPTSNPTTFNPTFNPTSNPTFNPSVNPITFNPTFNPIFNPTFDPTFNPSFNPITFSPTNSFTTTYDSSETLPVSSSQNNILTDLYGYLSVGIIIIFITIGIAGWFDACFIRKNDMFKVSYVIVFGVYGMDFVSDIFFTCTVAQYGNWFLFIACCIFLIAPVSLNLIQLRNSIVGWMDDPDNGLYITSFMSKYAKIMGIISLIIGSGFAVIQLFNSALFRMKLFSMGLKKHQLTEFQNKRLFSIVLLENFPQIILQTVFVLVYKENISVIPIMALVFSVLSIMLSIFEYFTKKSVVRRQSTTHCDVFIITFDVIFPKDLCKKRNALKYRTSGITAVIASILNIDKEFVEQLKSVDIQSGLKVVFRVTTDLSHFTLIELKQKISDSIQNGLLVENVKSVWTLNQVPIVKNLSVRHSTDPTATNSTISLQPQIQHTTIHIRKETE